MAEYFVGTKIVKGTPMPRAEYNQYRDWQLPANENGDDEGYLVEYIDGGASNDPRHTGYISWSPKAQFDNANVSLGDPAQLMQPHELRLLAEKAQLDDRLSKLCSFICISPVFQGLSERAQHLLREQRDIMIELQDILGERCEALVGVQANG